MKHLSGLTLLELLFCFMLGFGLFLLGLSWQSQTYQRHQMRGVEDDLDNAVRFARTMAWAKNQSLTLAPLAVNKDWSEGLVLFADNPAEPLQQWKWNFSKFTLIWKGFYSDGYLLFSPTLKHAACNGHFIIGNQRIGFKKLIVNRFGRTRWTHVDKL